MKVLSVNAGSSSLKFQAYEMPEEKVLISGTFERIGIEGSTFTIKYNVEKIVQEVELNNHVDAVNILIEKLTSLEIIKSLYEIDGIGHRVAHGKDFFDKSTVINDSVIEKIREIKNQRQKDLLILDNLISERTIELSILEKWFYFQLEIKYNKQFKEIIKYVNLNFRIMSSLLSAQSLQCCL